MDTITIPINITQKRKYREFPNYITFICVQVTPAEPDGIIRAGFQYEAEARKYCDYKKGFRAYKIASGKVV